MQHNLLFATDNNGIQGPYPDDWVQHPGTFSKQHLPDMTQSDASCTPCYLGHRQLSWLGLCMYTLSCQSCQPAILHFDECYICKQKECLMIQQGHTIFILESKTWKIWFLCWDICLWKHSTVLIDCTEPIAFVCTHFDRYSHSLFQVSVDCIHHLHRNFGRDQQFLVAQVLPEFHQPSLINVQFKSNIHLSQIVLMHTLMILCRVSVSVSESSLDYEAVFNFSLIASCSHSNSDALHCASLSSKTESEVPSTSLLT